MACVVFGAAATSALVIVALFVAPAAMTSLSGHHHVTTTTSARPPLRPESGPCELSVSDVWVTGFAKLMTESALRTLDVNQDGVLDVLLGFATGQRNTFPPYRQRRRSWGFGWS